MSRTDKDRPYRIREYFAGQIEHDHRFGHCTVETFTEAKRGYIANSHYSRCKKRSRVPTVCPGAGWGWGSCRVASEELKKLTFSERVDRGLYYDLTGRLKCDQQHWKYEYDETAPCGGCDDIAARRNITCEYRLPADKRAYYRYATAPPAWFVNHVYHAPMRRDARDVLRNAARDYNTYGETDVDEDLTELHQHSAKWLWW